MQYVVHICLLATGDYRKISGLRIHNPLLPIHNRRLIMVQVQFFRVIFFNSKIGLVPILLVANFYKKGFSVRASHNDLNSCIFLDCFDLLQGEHSRMVLNTNYSFIHSGNMNVYKLLNLSLRSLSFLRETAFI